MKTASILHRAIRTVLMTTCLILCAASVFPQSPTEDHKHWELGLRIHQLSFENNTRLHETMTVSQASRLIHLQLFGLRFLKAQTFIRGAAGLTYGSSAQTVQRSNNIAGEAVGSRLVFHSEIGVGYEFPTSQHTYLNRLRFRTGLVLAESNTLMQKHVTRNYYYDPLGNLIRVPREFTEGGFLEFSPQAFFQFEVRVWKQLYLGLEWRNGPLLTMSRLIRTNNAGGFLLGQNFTTFSWNTRFYPSLFSIGYSF